MRHKLQSFTTLPFLLCLGILLLNDFYLKEAFHNALTGKLSDFCGLYIFPIFWSAFFPNKKREIYVLTALLFVLWKSPFSQAFIDLFSSYIYHISRVVDISDLWALWVLPFSYFSYPNSGPRLSLNPYILAVVCFLSFCATSRTVVYQEFKNPQYILLKANELNFESTYFDRIEIDRFDLDSVEVIEVKSIPIPPQTVLKDDFQKVIVLKKLDESLMKHASEYLQFMGKDLLVTLDSLRIKGKTQIILEKENYREILNFSGTRLEGEFIRESYEQKPILKGSYKQGIEDSTWGYFNENSEIIKKEIYLEGELSQVITFGDALEAGVEIILTREQKLQAKHFQLAFLLILAIATLLLIIQTYKKYKAEESIILLHWKKILLSLGLPFLLILLDALYASFFPNFYGEVAFSRIFRWIRMYVVSFPLFLLILYLMKPRKMIHIFLYVLLLSLGAMIIHDIQYISALAESMK